MSKDDIYHKIVTSLISRFVPERYSINKKCGIDINIPYVIMGDFSNLLNSNILSFIENDSDIYVNYDVVIEKLYEIFIIINREVYIELI